MYNSLQLCYRLGNFYWVDAFENVLLKTFIKLTLNYWIEAEYLSLPWLSTLPMYCFTKLHIFLGGKYQGSHSSLLSSRERNWGTVVKLSVVKLQLAPSLQDTFTFFPETLLPFSVLWQQLPSSPINVALSRADLFSCNTGIYL